jgi:hypothetical protein
MTPFTCCRIAKCSEAATLAWLIKCMPVWQCLLLVKSAWSIHTCGWTEFVRIHKDVPELGLQLRKLLWLLGGQQCRGQWQQGTGCNSAHIAILVLQATAPQ